MSVQAGTAYVPFEGDFSGLISGLSATLSSSSLKSAGKKGGLAIGGALVAGVVAAGIGKAVASSLSKAIDFQSSFADVRKTVDATEKGYARLEKGIRGMSKVIPTGANELAELAGVAGQLGVKNRSIIKFTRTVADLGETTDLHGEDAAKTLARIANIMQTSEKDYGRLGSTIVDLGNNMATTESEITDMALRLAKSGNQVGLSEDQVLAFSAALSSVGIEADAGGSAFSKAFINMAMAVREGGRDLERYGRVAGVTGKEIGDLFNQDAASAMVLVTEGLGRIRKEGGNVFGTLEKLGIKEVRMRDAMLGAAGAGDLFRKSLKLGSDAWKENTALADEAAQRYGTTKSQMQLLKNTWDDVMISLGEMVRPTWDRAVRQVRDGVAKVGKVLGNPKLTGKEKFHRLVKMFTDAVVAGIENAADVAAQLAPSVAQGFAKGFANAPIWAQLGGAMLMLKLLGGPRSFTAAGLSAGGMFGKGFGAAAAGFGGGTKGWVSAFALRGALDMKVAARTVGTAFMRQMKTTLPSLAAVFGIGDVVTTALAGDTKGALAKSAGGLAGAGIGALIGSVFPGIGTAIGAAIGGGIGVGLGGAINNLFAGGDSPMKTLQEKIQESSKRLARGIKAEVASISGLRQAAKGQVEARRNQKRAAERTAAAERELNRARRQHGPSSERARGAEARYKLALDESRKAEAKLRKANRLQGAERRATVRIIRENVQEAKANIGQLRTERKAILKRRDANLKNKGSVEDLKKIQSELRANSKQLDSAQGKVNRSIQRAGQVIGPKFARSLEKITVKSSEIRRALPQLGRVTQSSMAIANGATRKASVKFDALRDTVIDTRKTFGTNMRGSSNVTSESMDKIVGSLQNNLEAVQNTGIPQAKRRGGPIEALRQRLRDGGVPVALSPGELVKTPDGKAGYVPGRPVAADNFITTLPVASKVFTFDGQRRLAEGASEGQALKAQLPHFAKGGIVKPEMTGGTPMSREVANKAIGKTHAAAARKLKKAKREAEGGYLGGGSGSLNAFERLGHSFGLQTTSGFRPGDSGYHGSNRARDLSNSTGPTPQMMAFAKAAAARWGQSMRELIYTPLGWSIKDGRKVAPYAQAAHYNHVHGAFRVGGLIQALQEMAKGGWVKTGYTTFSGYESNGYMGTLNKGDAYAELGTATSGGTGTGTGYIAKALGMSGELPHGFPLDVKIGSKVGRLFKRDRGYGQGDPFYSIDIHENGWDQVGLSGNNKGTAYIRTVDGSGGGGGGSASKTETKKQKREKQLKQLREAARGSKSPLAKKGAWWKLIEAHTKWGEFGKGEGRKMLLDARSIAGIANPNLGSGKLARLANWMDRKVDVTGGKENTAMSKRLAAQKKQGEKLAKKTRKRIMSRISRLSEKFPFTGRLKRMDNLIGNTAEWIQLAEREHTADWSAGGSEYTDAEVDYERRLNENLLRHQRNKRGTLGDAIPYARHLVDMYGKSITAARKNPADRWRMPGFKRGLTAAKSTLGELRTARTSLVGVTGKGGELADTLYRLSELGSIGSAGSDTGNDSALADMLREQLQIAQRNSALFAAQMPIFEQFLPRYHTGGVVPGRGEQPAVLMGGEGVFTREQMAAMGGPGDVVVHVHVDKDAGVDPERIRVEIENVARERASRVRRRTRSVV